MIPAIHRQPSPRLMRLKRLFLHLISTLVIVFGLTIGVERFEIPSDFADIAIPVVALVFIAHALWFSYTTARDRINQEEQGIDEYDEKPKRAQRLVLSDDGELVDFVAEPEEKAKRG